MILEDILGWTLAGVGTGWVVFALWAWRRGVYAARIFNGGARRRRIRADVRVAAILVALLGMGLLVLALFLMKAHPPKPEEWIALLLIGAFLGGLAPGLAAALWVLRMDFGPEGFTAVSFWGMPRRLRWDQVRDARYSVAANGVRIEGHPQGPIYMPEAVEGYVEFASALRERAGLANLSDNLQKPGDAEQLLAAACTQLHNAPRVAAISAAAFAFTALFHTPDWSGMWAAWLAGVIYGLRPVLARRRPAWSESAEGVATILLILGVTTHDAMDDLVIVAVGVQMFGAAAFVSAVMRLLHRRLDPGWRARCAPALQRPSTRTTPL